MDNSFIHFLQNLLRDGLAVNLNYFTPPFADISLIDIGLRKGLLNSDQLYQNLIEIMTSLENRCFYIYSDGYYMNYIFCHPFDDKPDVIVLGPYLQAPVTQEYIDNLIQTHRLKHTEIESIRGLLYQIPVFDNNIRLISILMDIINYKRPQASAFQLKESNMQERFPDTKYIPIDNYMLNVTATEQRYALQEPLLQAISKGDAGKALEITRQFMSMAYGPRLNDLLYDKKAAMFSVNTLLRIGAQRGNVHPVFIHELSATHVKLINQAMTLSELNRLHEKIVRNYCLLVQNKSRSKYSKLVRDTLNYIDFNLSQPLTLSVLANYSHVTSPYLSKIFKKELDCTVTDYVTQTRIHESIRLLSTTSMMIQEIAAHVGILDFNYYTKTFKKYIGCTPTEYRKKLSE